MTQVATRTVAWGTGTVTVRYQHTDALGSIVAETTPSKVVVSRTAYTPYGEATPAKDGTGYTGAVMDAGTGLTYMQQRYYDPQVGRFLSVDPAASEFNQYSYAGNNPYRFTDPDGRKKEAAEALEIVGPAQADGASNSGCVRCRPPESTKTGEINISLNFGNGSKADGQSRMNTNVPDPNKTDRPAPAEHPGPWKSGYVFPSHPQHASSGRSNGPEGSRNNNPYLGANMKSGAIAAGGIGAVIVGGIAINLIGFPEAEAGESAFILETVWGESGTTTLKFLDGIGGEPMLGTTLVIANYGAMGAAGGGSLGMALGYYFTQPVPPPPPHQ